MRRPFYPLKTQVYTVKTPVYTEKSTQSIVKDSRVDFLIIVVFLL